MAVREFDAVDDILRTAVGALSGFTYGTVALLVKRTVANNWHGLFVPHTIAGTATGLDITFVPGNTITWYNNAQSDGPAITANIWYLIVVRKATGSAFPRFSVYNYDTASWAHAPGSAALGDSTAPGVGGSIRFDWQGGDLPAIRVAARAAWSNILPWSADTTGDAAIVAANLHLAYQNWIDNSPSAAWKFDQASTSTAVVDDTGNGADQIEIAGTTVVTTDDPTGFDFTLGGGPVQGAAALSASSTMTAAGTATSRAASTLTADGTLTASGQARSQASASLSAQSTMTTAARVRALAAATLSALGTLTASTGAVRGAASLAASATMTVAARARALGAATLSSNATMTTADTARAQAAAALSSSGTLGVLGRVRALGRAILSALGTLTAAGNLPGKVPPHPDVLTLTPVADAHTLAAVPDVLTLTALED